MKKRIKNTACLTGLLLITISFGIYFSGDASISPCEKQKFSTFSTIHLANPNWVKYQVMNIANYFLSSAYFTDSAPERCKEEQTV